MPCRHRTGVEVGLYIVLLVPTFEVNGGRWSTPYSDHFTFGKEFRYILYRRLGVPWGQSWRCTENLSPTGIRTPDRSTRTELLYRLRYPGRVIEFVLVQIMNRNRYPVCFIIKTLKSTGYYTTQEQPSIFPTECSRVFCTIRAIWKWSFPVQHLLIFFVMEAFHVLCNLTRYITLYNLICRSGQKESCPETGSIGSSIRHGVLLYKHLIWPMIQSMPRR
jgi:hypothetical protein